ncbi:MAG: hypothetical protein ACOC5R_04420 [Elusimicrobiota bacterium]
MEIVDINSDRNLHTLLNATNKLASSEAINDIYDLAIEKQNNLEKTASSVFALEDKQLFPLDTPEDTVLSKVYFDHQFDKFAEKDREKANEKLEAFLNLHNIPEDIFDTVQEKTASDKEESHYLLPSLEKCAVRNKDDLEKAADVFIKEAHKLDLLHRVEFAQEFCKMASKWGHVPYPDSIAKYASTLDTDMTNLSYMLEIRSAAASREGKDGSIYTKLANSLMDVEENPDKKELTKLAKLIHKIDSYYGFDAPEYDRKFPDAFGVVFNKQAEEDKEEAIDKSKIVAQYGVEALDAIEDEEGNIDQEKLKQLEQKYGDRNIQKDS